MVLRSKLDSCMAGPVCHRSCARSANPCRLRAVALRYLGDVAEHLSHRVGGDQGVVDVFGHDESDGPSDGEEDPGALDAAGVEKRGNLTFESTSVSGRAAR
ncbi:MAG: hypothetical protein QOJ29_5405 [Thermoleophilaceae bacterium]|nr:hypothetical protein [Thermoleophilaceae bacterium]